MQTDTPQPPDDAEQAPEVQCPACGQMSPAGYTYCIECGSYLVLPPPDPIEPITVTGGIITPPPAPDEPVVVDAPEPPMPYPVPLPPPPAFIPQAANPPAVIPPVSKPPAAKPPAAEDVRSPLLDDQPSLDDQLGFSAYCTALRDTILHPNTRTPLTLGIFGRWGTGKTTLMHMLERELKERRLATVWFNAWLYNKEDQLWAAFLQSLLNRLQEDLSPFQRLVFSVRLLWARVNWKSVPQAALLYLGRVLVVALPFIISWPISQQLRQLVDENLLHWGGGMASTGLAGWLLVKPAIEAVRKNVEVDFNALRKDSSYDKHIAFLDSFRGHFQDVVKSLPVKGDKRLAVFVDDLDRCSSDGTLQVLDAIKLFLDIPGCIFILGVDVEVVQKAVAGKYKDDLLAQREYLGKIVQLPFYLPALSRRDTRRFVEQIVPQLPDGRCRSVFIEGLATNPREIKRALSVFAMLWSLATHKPELGGIITPVRLARVVVIRQSYPDLYKLLEANPQYLIDLEAHFRGILPAGQVEAPGSLPKALEPFAGLDGLRRMLLLHPPIAGIRDETGFIGMKAEDVAVYFTLTQETPYSSPTVAEPSSVHLPSFGERYETRKLLGRGGMSSVYLAWDRQLQQSVALKVVSPALQTDPLTRARLQREIQLLYRLDHPNIVRIYDDGVFMEHDQEIVYYAMEYLDGESLKDVLTRKGKLTPAEAIKVLVPILHALEYIHRLGIIHRDLKPSAVGMTSGKEPRLMDLGIARMLEGQTERITQTGAWMGTPGYMSPEQFQSNVPDARSDLYSFGVLLYQCLAGRRPFLGDTIPAELVQIMSNDPPDVREFTPGISPDLAGILNKLLARKPEDRYQDAQEVYRALLMVPMHPG